MCAFHCGVSAPRLVHAGSLKNNGSKTVQCTVYYALSAGEPADDTLSVTVEPGDEVAIPERSYTPDGASYTARKNVSRIDVEAGGQTFSLQEPFEGVTSPTLSWKFHIFDDHIASVGSE